jgi:Tfp pilus assembly protein PilP
MHVLRVCLAFVVLMSAQMVRAQTPSPEKPVKPAPAPQAQAPAKPGPAIPAQTPAKPAAPPAASPRAPVAPAKPAAPPPAASPPAPVAPAKAVPPPAPTPGQAPASAAPPAAGPAAPTSTSGSGETYVYRAEGRRDPFLTLIGTGAIPRDASHKEGPAGMMIGEISVRGIMQSKGALVAMIQGPDNKTYIVHQGDKLLDGAIKTITPQGLIVIQEVNDPLSLVKQREVRKLLRSLEDAKE